MLNQKSTESPTSTSRPYFTMTLASVVLVFWLFSTTLTMS